MTARRRLCTLRRFRRSPWYAPLALLLPLGAPQRADASEGRSEPTSEPQEKRPERVSRVRETVLLRVGPEIGWMQYGGAYELSYETDRYSGDTVGKFPQSSAFSRALRAEFGAVLYLYADKMAVAPKGTFSYGWLGQNTADTELLGQAFSWDSRVKFLTFGTGFEFQFLKRKLVLTPEAGITNIRHSIQTTSPEGVDVSAKEGGIYGRANAGYRMALSPSFALVAMAHASYLVILKEGLDTGRSNLGATLFLEWDPFRIEENK